MTIEKESAEEDQVPVLLVTATEGSTARTTARASNPLRVGAVFWGYCDGFFGRDGYGEKRVEAIGADWIVVRLVDAAYPDFVRFTSPAEMEQMTTRWLREITP